MSTLESGPKLDWTRDNQMYERYRIWRKKVEFIFCSALADSTPKQLVSYLKYWMGDQGIPLIEKWESTGKLDYSNAKETPATEDGRRRALSSGYKVQTYWDLLDEEFKPKDNGVEIQHSDPDPDPTPDFPFQEFPLTEVVNQSQIDYYSISDTPVPREYSNSSRKAIKSGLNSSTHEELREIKGSAVSTAPTQSSRDSNTISISDNSATRESNPGIIPRITTGIMTTLPVETDVTAIHSNNHKSVIPTDTQALTVLQDLVSDDLQAKNTPSTQRKREDTRSIQRKGEDETLQLIQKIHNQLQQVQWDLQRLHSLHKYKN